MAKILQGQINQRRGTHLIEGLPSLLEVTKQQFELGEAAGMEMALKMPEMIAQQLEESVNLQGEDDDA